MPDILKQEGVFRFKQFQVQHKNSGMKVGTDGVLLGVLTDIEHSKNILDVGCGCGLIALMLAQRSGALIDAIDIEGSAVSEALYNVECSPWSNRIGVYHSSFQDFCTDVRIAHYDLIVSNPPFFIDSLKNPHFKKSLARHSDSLPFESLISGVIKLLKPKGLLWLILPVQEAGIFIQSATASGLFLNQYIEIFPNESKPAVRLVMAFSKEEKDVKRSCLVIETDERHQYTQAFKDLAKDFYLKL